VFNDIISQYNRGSLADENYPVRGVSSPASSFATSLALLSSGISSGAYLASRKAN